jgi:hypothetical protein
MTEITRDALLARRTQLAAEEKIAWANLNAVLGAIQDCDFWLARLAEPPLSEPADIEALRQARQSS